MYDQCEIRALVLAAGKGTRLQPLTLTIPKCLVSVGGKPLLKRWLESLEDIDCRSVIINTHYLHDQVEDYIKNQDVGKISLKLKYEPKLLGTAGTLYQNRFWFRGCMNLIIHCDNYYDGSLELLLNAHKERSQKCILTMLTFDCDDPSSCGITQVNQDGILTGFHEKSQNFKGTRANAAIYVFEDDFLDWLEYERNLFDISLDIIPKLLGKIQTVHTIDKLVDIGTWERLNKLELELNDEKTRTNEPFREER